jgi:hypothetical protein
VLDPHISIPAGLTHPQFVATPLTTALAPLDHAAYVSSPEVNDWLLTAWPFESHLFRVLPGERSSRAALEQHGLRRRELEVPGERRPYLWYQPV